GGADVSGQFSVFEQSPVEQLSSLDGGPACCRESGYAQSHDESVSSAGGLDAPATGGQSRLGGGPDIAPQGGVDSAGDEIDLPGGVDDPRGELGGHMAWQMAGFGIDHDHVVVGEEPFEGLTRIRCTERDRAQPCLGEQGPAGVAAGEVVGDDKDSRIHLVSASDGVSAHTTRSRRNSSGSEQIHTAVVIPDQPLIAWMPSSPAKRVTTQK